MGIILGKGKVRIKFPACLNFESLGRAGKIAPAVLLRDWNFENPDVVCPDQPKIPRERFLSRFLPARHTHALTLAGRDSALTSGILVPPDFVEVSSRQVVETDCTECRLSGT